MENTIDRRSLIGKVGLLGMFGGFALAGAGSALADEAAESDADTEAEDTKDAKDAEGSEAAEPAAEGEVTQWVDAVSSASVATNVYTNLDEEQLYEAINSYTAECMFATTNEDGTPNLAVFAGGYALGEGYIIFNWYDNQTKANLLRSRLGMIGYDIVDLAAEEKTGRHQGALVKVELVDGDERDELAAGSEYINEGTVVVKVVEILPIG